MYRRAYPLLATSIPRSAWDPAHHNPNWTDSYATDIAARRHWPAKKWSIALDPRTPRDWLRFSYRNLAYAYNGALRACTTFPEMIVYYTEMKQRGVKVDVDTLNVLLTRAARYEHIHTDDIFLLFDEMTSLGARPDIAAVETLHTVLEHSAQKPFEWREARRRQLVELYNYLALEEIARLAPHKADALLAAQMARLRNNLRQLHASLSPSVYRRYLAVIDSGDLLLREVHHFLWEFVEPEHPAMELPSLQLRIPHVGTVMKRPAVNSDPAAVKPTDFEDTDVCSVFLAAVERCIDADFHDARPISARRMYLTLLTMLTLSGVLYTSDLVAQLMDIVKYSPIDRSRDVDAQRLLRYALRGSSATEDEAYRQLWRRVEKIVDARVVGRYIASRDPWTTLHICYDDKFMFRSYPPPQLVAARSATEKDAAGQQKQQQQAQAERSATSKPTENVEGVNTELLMTEQPEEPAGDSPNSNNTTGNDAPATDRQTELRTPEGLQLRWKDIKKLIERTGVLRDGPNGAAAPHAMEVFTGQSVFLRTVATGHRYSDPADAFATQAVGEGTQTDLRNSATGPVSAAAFAEGMHLNVWQQLFANTKELHSEMEKYLADHEGAEPEFECWEGLLVTLRCILNFAASQVQQGSSTAAESLFKDAAALRLQLVEQSLTRFGGRMRILWLQEA